MSQLEPRLIAIGASAGGIEALRVLVAGLPKGLPAAVVIASHLSAKSPGYLPELLASAGTLPAASPVDDEPLLPGRIYVAPPDQHILVRPGHIVLSRGAKENWMRPAVDPLFRSVAVSFRNRAIGVILTGKLYDGTAGLAAIKDRGGITVVQNPADAAAPSMPKSALRCVAVDHVVTLNAMAPLLVKLVEKSPPMDLGDLAVARHARHQSMSKPLNAQRLFGTVIWHPALSTSTEPVITILYVEDDAAVRDVVFQMLVNQGFRVLAATSADEALRILAERPVDLLFADIVLPGIDGVTLAQQAKYMRPEIKVLFATGFPMTAHERDAIKHGKLLYKPLRRAELLYEVEAALAA
jgi:chemotaxis response regulator CheB